MIKLTEEQKADIINLNKEGKKAADIIAVLKEKYKMVFKPAKIYYALKGQGATVKGKRKGSKRSKKANEQRSVAGEIIGLVERLERANQAIFAYLRTSLIRKLSEKHAVMTKEQIEIPEGDEITPGEAI